VADRRSLRLVLAAASASVALLSVAGGARAEAEAPAKARVEWSPQWSRLRWWEYAGTAALDLGSLYLYGYRKIPEQQKWRGENTFDDTVRGWLRAETREGRVRADRISDFASVGQFVVPFAIDVPLVLLVHRNLDVTWQLLMMDVEAFAVAGFLNNVLFYSVGRGRPDLPECSADPSYHHLCGLGNYASFPSGHTLGIATSAGLSCVHHRYLPLYGHPAADAGACVVMSAAAVVTGVARIVSDRHFTSDVLVGAALGFASGYGVPWLLHYRSRGEAGTTEGSERGGMVLPFVGPRHLGVGLVGAL
jgi:membrane-associated phospholipid phosphatase